MRKPYNKIAIAGEAIQNCTKTRNFDIRTIHLPAAIGYARQSAGPPSYEEVIKMLNKTLLLCTLLTTRYKTIQAHPGWTISRYMRLVKWLPRKKRTMFNRPGAR